MVVNMLQEERNWQEMIFKKTEPVNSIFTSSLKMKKTVYCFATSEGN